MADAVLVQAVRTAVGRAPMGALAQTRPDDLAANIISGVLERLPQLDPAEIDDVILGCAHQEGGAGWNIARFASLRAGLPVEVPGVTVNRLCGSGLEALALADLRIRAGDARVIVAGGVESMSLLPVGGLKPSPNPWLAEHYPASLLSMGQTAERVAAHYGVSRAAQDAYALRSHQRAVAAQAAGRFAAEILPITVEQTLHGTSERQQALFCVDEGPRPNASIEVLSRLKPAFQADGTVTAGNSSPTSDGAAAAVLMDARRAAELGLRPLGRLLGFAATGCPPEEMGIGPINAIPLALKRAGLHLDQIELIELNEAFAAQAVAVIRTLQLNEQILNVNGGAIALGHPLGATGAKLTTTLLHEMRRRGARYGLVAMCMGGGMGAAGVWECLS